MSDMTMPSEIVQWIQQQNWGMHHLEWHVTRLWARPEIRAIGESQGWTPAAIQEGQSGNGLGFLAMHRVMIRQLVAAFPQQSGLFRGWRTPPTDPNDATDPLPATSQAPGPFDPDMLIAVATAEGPVSRFQTDDEFGLYVETNRRPTAVDPNQLSTDTTTGIHNYLHARFTGDSDAIDMGNPQVNLLNRRFWRLHGWIDAQWSRFRQAKGFSETEADYQAALRDAEHHMAMHMMPMMAALHLAPEAIGKLVPLSQSVRASFFSWGKRQPPPAAAAGAAAPDPTAPTWTGTAGQNDGIKDLFRPVDIEHMRSSIVLSMTGTIYNLDDYDDVKNNAVKIYGMVKNGRMPPNQPWDAAKIAKFKAWMDAGLPKG